MGSKTKPKRDHSGQVRIAAVGDVQLGDCSACTGYGIASRYPSADLQEIFDAVRPALAADCTIGNLETVLSRKGVEESRWASLHMRGYPEYAGSLRFAGFTILNVANNHMFQYGHAAFLDTIGMLRAQGIQVCGERGEGAWSSRPTIVNLPTGRRIGFLGYSLRPRQFQLGQPPYAEGSSSPMLADVDRLSADADHIVVSLHWGEEYVGQPTQSGVELGHALVEAGADVVIGHHPHVTGPVERFRGGVIAYSLGNFVTDMLWHDALRNGLILRLTLNGDGVSEISPVPTRVDRHYRVHPRREEIDELVVEQLEGLTDAAHASLVKRTVRENRWAKYGYAIAHLHRYPPRILAQLVLQTFRNKLGIVRPEMRLRRPFE
jgi:gamma-polyglutamate biosynthesis protein CapA